MESTFLIEKVLPVYFNSDNFIILIFLTLEIINAIFKANSNSEFSGREYLL